MMTRRITAPALVLLAVILGLFVAAPALRLLKHIEKRGPAAQRVTAILPGDLEATAGRLRLYRVRTL